MFCFVVDSLEVVVEEEEDLGDGVRLLLCFHVDLLFPPFLSFLLFFPSDGEVSVPEGGRKDLRGSLLERGPEEGACRCRRCCLLGGGLLFAGERRRSNNSALFALCERRRELKMMRGRSPWETLNTWTSCSEC